MIPKWDILENSQNGILYVASRDGWSHGWPSGDPAVGMENVMTKPRNETTSPRAATAASKVLRDPSSSAAAKTAAASALTQTRNKGK
jgi:hypothetical protein